MIAYNMITEKGNFVLEINLVKLKRVDNRLDKSHQFHVFLVGN